ncbi:MAG: insulinase family protein [Candidatus Aminicenantes bacterium]|nr:insulinase family protein [Candidatus Aminicenantes bacterium]
MRKIQQMIGWGFILATAFIALSTAGEKQVPPEGGKPKDFVLPAKEDSELANGLRVTLVSYGQVPKAMVGLMIRTGNLNEPENEAWLANMTAKIMKEGTLSRSAKEIAAAAARMGGGINIGAGSDTSGISGDVLSEFAPEFIRLVADIAQNPLFPESELERLKNDLLRTLSIQSSQPETLALAKFRKAIYGDHPYGRILTTAETVKGFTMEKIRSYYEENFGAARSHIYVVGRFDAQAVRQAIRDAFGGWKRGPAPAIVPAKTDTRRSVAIVDRPGSQQSTLYVGLPVIDPSHKDSRALEVMNSLLGGGGFLSRITMNIREQKGYTYSPYSTVSSRYRDAYWVQVASVGNAVTAPALKEILGEIDRLRNEPPAEKELKDIQNFMSGTFVMTNSSRAGILNILSNQDLHGLSPDYLSTYVQTIHALTPQDVQRAAQEYLKPDKMIIVVVGEKKEIADSLKAFGPVVE